MPFNQRTLYINHILSAVITLNALPSGVFCPLLLQITNSGFSLAHGELLKQWIKRKNNFCAVSSFTSIVRKCCSTRYTYILYKTVFYTRSEEHTSELQSRGHLVCRLLL